MKNFLAKFPVKSLMRFKCLSKAYSTLITSNSSIRKHISYSTLATKNQPNLLLFHDHDKFAMTLVSDNQSSQPPINLISHFSFPNDRLDSIIAYGPSNGIFCLEVPVFDQHKYNAMEPSNQRGLGPLLWLILWTARHGIM